ncbi:MAG TPA: histidine ammonia-lyase [Polyangia bacterium]|nr:histidine ammonia-lyase [Polyangia bacterium]
MHMLGRDPLTLEAIAAVARAGKKVQLTPEARARIDAARRVVDRIQDGGDAAPAVYGVNTGFGFLADVRISADEIRNLQRNLIRSHAAGVGAPLPEPVVRAMMLLRAQVLSLGHSGVRAVVAELLCEMLNRGVHPVIPSKGSVGASGDLAPLAHLALVVMGEGEAILDGVRLPGGSALARAGLEPVQFEAKEGISLVNGTQCMTALGALALIDAEDAARLADVVGAMSLEALKGTPRAFDPRIHAVRPHPGQAASARNLTRLLADSGIVASHKNCGKVQDAYSLRCMPQVHGATRDALAYARRVLETEASSATDNPLVFADANEMISGGNFHGQPVAFALDFAGIAVAELANIAERRIEQMVNPHLSSGLPAFLSPESGLNSGYMMAQVTAAALVSENKILAHPASVDSIPSSAGREDHVSMGVHAADKLARIVDNVRNVLAIELLCAAQGVDLRAPHRPGPALDATHAAVRTRVAPLGTDRVVHRDVDSVRSLIDDGTLVAAARRHIELE